MRHHRIAHGDIAVGLFPRRAIAIRFARRNVAIGFATRGTIPARALVVALTTALAATFRAKLAVALALAAARPPTRSATIAPIGKSALTRRPSALSATGSARNAHAVAGKRIGVGVAHRLLIVEIHALSRRARSLALSTILPTTLSISLPTILPVCLRAILLLTLPLPVRRTLATEALGPGTSMTTRASAMLAARTLPGLTWRTHAVANGVANTVANIVAVNDGLRVGIKSLRTRLGLLVG